MKWHYDNDRPIYMQIVEQIETGIVTGAYPPGSGMPSVRVLAVEAGVNPNTMQKALAELETMGLLHTQRTAGRTVTEDGIMIEKLKGKLAEDHIRAFFTGMADLGIGKKEAIGMLKNSDVDGDAPSKAQRAGAKAASAAGPAGAAGSESAAGLASAAGAISAASKEVN